MIGETVNWILETGVQTEMLTSGGKSMKYYNQETTRALIT